MVRGVEPGLQHVAQEGLAGIRPLVLLVAHPRRDVLVVGDDGDPRIQQVDDPVVDAAFPGFPFGTGGEVLLVKPLPEHAQEVRLKLVPDPGKPFGAVGRGQGRVPVPGQGDHCAGEPAVKCARGERRDAADLD